ncbi:MAG: dTMP kinase [Acidimicrobiia bacterium]
MTGLARRYIAIEGIEGAGKSTVAKAIADHLKTVGHPAIFVREPGGTDVGERIREILLGNGDPPSPRAEAVLFAASRAQLVETVIKPALMDRSWVVSDRSAYSSLAYQAIGRGLDLTAIRNLNDIAIDGLWPGRVVLLRLSAEAGLERQAVDDRIGSEAITFHHRVADGFDALAAAEPDRFIVVDAEPPVTEVIGSVIDGLGL